MSHFKNLVCSLLTAFTLTIGILGEARAETPKSLVKFGDEVWRGMGSQAHFGYEWFYFDLKDEKGNQLAVT